MGNLSGDGWSPGCTPTPHKPPSGRNPDGSPVVATVAGLVVVRVVASVGSAVVVEAFGLPAFGLSAVGTAGLDLEALELFPFFAVLGFSGFGADSDADVDHAASVVSQCVPADGSAEESASAALAASGHEGEARRVLVGSDSRPASTSFQSPSGHMQSLRTP